MISLQRRPGLASILVGLMALLLVGLAERNADASLLNFNDSFGYYIIWYPEDPGNPDSPIVSNGFKLFDLAFDLDNVNNTLNITSAMEHYNIEGFTSINELYNATGGEPWTFNLQLSDIDYTPGGAFPTQTPSYNDMFLDLLNAGYDSGARIYYNNLDLSFYTDVINPEYKGATQFVGVEGAIPKFGGETVVYEYFGTGYDRIFGWVDSAPGQPLSNGDYAIFVNPVPEPGTLSLMGFGLGALFMNRRKRKTS